MKVLIVFIFAFLVCACEKPNSYSPSLKCKLINEVERNAAKQTFLKTKLMACGTGAQAMDEIKMLALSFNYYQEVDVREGRELLVAALDTFRSVINADENIRPYLVSYPFKPENVEIRIFIKNRDGTTVGLNKLYVLSVIGGILQYQVHTSDGMWLNTIHEETYAEALEKLDSASS